MSIQELYADECKKCSSYSNSGFDVCEDCFLKFMRFFISQQFDYDIDQKELEKSFEEWNINDTC